MRETLATKISGFIVSPAAIVTAHTCANDGYLPTGRVYGPAHWMMGNWLEFGILGTIVSLAFWILAIVGIIYLIKYLMNVGRNKENEEDALEILKKRYAKGEISKEEYDKIKTELDKM